MHVLGMLLLMIQVSFAVHAVRRGRDTYWVYIILFVPAIGCMVYFVTQVLPDLERGRAVRMAGNRLVGAVDPQQELRYRKAQLNRCDSIEKRLQLADECMEAGMWQDAIVLYARCLQGVQQDDPRIMLQLAQAQFASNDYAETKVALDRLIEVNPDFRSADGHLLYARTLESLGMLEEAVVEYRVLADSYPGEEARARYGLLLKRLGDANTATAVFREILLRAKRAPRYYRKKEKHWIQLARMN